MGRYVRSGPLSARCGGCRIHVLRWGQGYPTPNLVRRTGRTRPGPHETTRHEYRCTSCGHVGWSTHEDIAGAPLDET